jgi:hypothetical protein
MKISILALMMLAGLAHAQAPDKWVWRSSAMTLIAGESSDIATSWQRPEGNALWASANGKFAYQGLGKSIAIDGAIIAVEYVALRATRHTKLARPMIYVFSACNVVSGAKSFRQARLNLR